KELLLMLIMIWLVFSFYHQLIFYLKSIFNFSYIFFICLKENYSFLHIFSYWDILNLSFNVNSIFLWLLFHIFPYHFYFLILFFLYFFYLPQRKLFFLAYL